jgi:transcriptional regulator with XRE-family HTH domain
MTREDAAKAPHGLADYVVARREELELTQAEAAKAAGVGLSTYQKIEYGYRAEPSRNTRNGIEDALRWTRGSIRAVLAGGEPTEVNDAPTEKPTSADDATADALHREWVAWVNEGRRLMELLDGNEPSVGRDR